MTHQPQNDPFLRHHDVPQWEYAELNLSVVDFESDPSCNFVPYGDEHQRDENCGEQIFERYFQALNRLGLSGWEVCAATDNPPKLFLKRLLVVAKS